VKFCLSDYLLLKMTNTQNTTSHGVMISLCNFITEHYGGTRGGQSRATIRICKIESTTQFYYSRISSAKKWLYFGLEIAKDYNFLMVMLYLAIEFPGGISNYSLFRFVWRKFILRELC